MLRIKHYDDDNQEYFTRLSRFVNKDLEPEYVGANYFLIVPKGSKPKSSVQHIGTIMLLLINQPDWDEVILDESFDPSKEEVWETLHPIGAKSLAMVLNEEKDAKNDNVILVRNSRKERPFTKRAILDLELFRSSVKHRLSRPLPFSYFVAAVAITFTFCYLLCLFTLIIPKSRTLNALRRTDSTKVKI